MRIGISGRTRACAMKKVMCAAVAVLCAGVLAACGSDDSPSERRRQRRLAAPISGRRPRRPSRSSPRSCSSPTFRSTTWTQSSSGPSRSRPPSGQTRCRTSSWSASGPTCARPATTATSSPSRTTTSTRGARPSGPSSPPRRSSRARSRRSSTASVRTYPRWLANFKSLVAQQPDIIVIDSIYGPAILPALQQAKAAGITVVKRRDAAARGGRRARRRPGDLGPLRVLRGGCRRRRRARG